MSAGRRRQGESVLLRWNGTVLRAPGCLSCAELSTFLVVNWVSASGPLGWSSRLHFHVAGLPVCAGEDIHMASQVIHGLTPESCSLHYHHHMESVVHQIRDQALSTQTIPADVPRAGAALPRAMLLASTVDSWVSSASGTGPPAARQ